MEITGKIIQLLPAQTGQGKNGTWKKQEFILETLDTYPKKVCIEVWGDKIDVTRFPLGTNLVASFDVESREFNGRWYTNVKAWKVVPKDAQPSGIDTIDQSPPPFTDEDPSDLPF